MNQDDHVDNSAPPEENQAEPVLLTVPFEDESKDFMTGLLETVKLVLFQPTVFFKNYKLTGSIGRPVLFAVIVGWIGSIISNLWGIVLRDSIFRFMQEHFPEIEGYEFDQVASGGGVLEGMGFLLQLIMAPVAVAIMLFVVAGIYHLMLLLVKGAGKSFETTINVVAYGAVSYLANVIPFVGGLIAMIYGYVLAVIGLTECHKTDSWKALFAVLAPLVLCCLCCLMFIFVVGGAGFLAGLADMAR